MTKIYSQDFEAAPDGALVNFSAFSANFQVGLASAFGLTAIGGSRVLVANTDGADYTYTPTISDNQAVRFATKIPALDTTNFRMMYVVLRSAGGASPMAGYHFYPETDGTKIRVTIYSNIAGNFSIVAQSPYIFAPASTAVVHCEPKAVGTAIEWRMWTGPESNRPATAASNSASALMIGGTDANIPSGKPTLRFRGAFAYAQLDNLVITDGAGGEDFFYAVGADTTAPVLTSPTATANTPTAATASVTTDEGAGTLYCYISVNATETAATIRTNGQSQAVTSAGVKTFNRTGLTANTAAYYPHFVQDDAASPVNTSTVVNGASFSTPAAGDTVAPNLTSPTGTKTGSTTASGTVTTDEATGLLHVLTSTNASETQAAVLASSFTQPVTASGVQNINRTGLTPAATMRHHYVHTDASGNNSNVASSAAFTLDASASFTFAPTVKLEALADETPFANWAIHAQVHDMSGALIATKTGLVTNSIGLPPPFTTGSGALSTDYQVTYIDDIDPKIRAYEILRAT